MLVRIKVGDRNTGGLQLADLGGGLGFNFIGSQAAQHRECPELADALAEARIAGAFTAAVQQAMDLRLGKQGSAVHQHDVASHSQPRRGLRQTHRLRKSPAVGHQRRRTHHAVFVGLHDGTIHPRRETKIVGVDDQAAHRASLAGMCRVNATSPRLESSAGSCRLFRGRPALGAAGGTPAATAAGTAALRKPAPPGGYFFSALTFAHRAFCARRIAARPLALKGRRVLFFDAPLPP